MALALGEKLGPYEVTGKIGAGGMGEVYRARDTRLDRVVAIKVLPAELSADEGRRARFEREARAVSSLSHPNICTLHDVGEHDGAPFLVMEHIEGETLAARLARVKGQGLPLGEALEIGVQVAEALAAAHRHGILHRDLKPANVMLTRSGAKLLDFGLAKLSGHGEQAARVSPDSVPTTTGPVTEGGMVLGTWPYVAPEQIEGKEADTRTDLWALGCVLYEMVTGNRPFTGESQASLAMAIRNGEPPPITQVQPLAPRSLDRLVSRCLAKSPDERWESARDLAYELRWIAETAGVAPTAEAGPAGWLSRRALARVAVGVAIGAVLATAVTWRLRPTTGSAPVVRSRLDVTPADELNAGGHARQLTPGGSRTALAWTPDGRSLVFVGRRDGAQQLYVRALDEPAARPLAGTEGAQMPTVSADGRSVAFWSDGAIRQVPLAGGPASILVPKRYLPWGMAWGVSGKLLVGAGPIRIATGREYSPVTTLAQGELRHVLPQWLPGDGTVLYTVRKRSRIWGGEEVVAQSLATGERTVLLRDAVDARYVAGHLVFLRMGTLFAVPFDPETLEVGGEPVALVAEVAHAVSGYNSNDVTGAGQFCVAPNGDLAYIEAPTVSDPDARIVTVDRSGRVTPLAAPERSYSSYVRLSPDGNRLALGVNSFTGQGQWIYDLPRGVLSRLPGEGEVWGRLWTPDGRRLVFHELLEGAHRLAWQLADGSGPPERLADHMVPDSWSPDGRTLLGAHFGDIWELTVGEGADAALRAVVQTPANEAWPALSPDGRWLAYSSNTSGRLEVYVQPYPGPGPRTQVSVDGGSDPAWHPNGRELFFVTPLDDSGQRQLMAAEITPGPTLGVGRPRVLFGYQQEGERLAFQCESIRCYDVAPDGQSFYVRQAIPRPPQPPVTHIHLVQSWLEEVKARLAAAPPS